VFAQNEPLYRFLLKATRLKAEERFQTAGEMAEQLVGVLHAILGDSSDLGRIESALFEHDGDLHVDSGSVKRASDGLPRLKVDKEDAAAGIILAAGAIGDPDRRRKMFEQALKTHPNSADLRLRLVDQRHTLPR